MKKQIDDRILQFTKAMNISMLVRVCIEICPKATGILFGG